MKTALAPMATLSHEALRLLIHRWGDPDEYFSEMINASTFVAGGKFEHWYVRSAPCPERMVWQLTGSSPESLAKAAALLAREGGIGVDINMGCSAPDIAKTGAGVAWMGKPLEEVAEMVGGVRLALDSAGVSEHRRLSVKLRLGENEDEKRLLEFCRMLVGEGVELITLHPRVRRDKYSRPARPSFVASLASAIPVPVYGNGDISNAPDALSYAASWPCAGVMIGRAAVRTPWIFGDIRRAAADANTVSADNAASATVPADAIAFADRAASAGTAVPAASAAAADRAATADPASAFAADPYRDHLEIADFFLNTLVQCQPTEFHISRAHRFFFYYCENFTFAHHIKMKIQNAQTPDEIRGLLSRYFEEVPQDRFRR